MTSSDIIAAAALVTGIPVSVITSRRRRIPAVSRARNLAIAGIRQELEWMALKEIGEIFGRSSSSIFYALGMHKAAVKSDPTYARFWAQLKKDLYTL